MTVLILHSVKTVFCLLNFEKVRLEFGMFSEEQWRRFQESVYKPGTAAFPGKMNWEFFIL